MAPVPPQLGLTAQPPLGDRLGQSHHDSDPGACRSLSLPGLLSSPSIHLYHLIVCDRVLMCHPPSLDYELLQGWNEPESSLPSAHDRTWLNVGAAQQIFVEFPSESNRKRSHPCLGMILVETAFPDHPVCELCSPQGMQQPSMQSMHQHPPHFSIVFLLMLSIAGFIPAHSHFLSWKITRKLHAAPGNLANTIQTDSSTWPQVPAQRHCHFQLCGLSPSASLGPPATLPQREVAACVPSWPSSHPHGAPWWVHSGLGGAGREINMDVSCPVGISPSITS